MKQFIAIFEAPFSFFFFFFIYFAGILHFETIGKMFCLLFVLFFFLLNSEEFYSGQKVSVCMY